MALIEKTMIELITQKIEENSVRGDSTVQLKIPTDIFPLPVIYMVLKNIQELYITEVKKNVIIKIASQAIQHWELSSTDSRKFVKKIIDNNPDWVDGKGNLTFYRNDLATNQDKSIQQILILVGGDKVNDQASLEHIPNLGIQEIWIQGMNSTFISWVKDVSKETSYSDSIQDDANLLNDCDRLLKIILLYSDILSIATYLEELPIDKDLSGGATIFESLAIHLDLLQLGSCLTLDRRKARWSNDLQNVLAQVYSFFSGHITLENAKYSRSLKCINDIIENLETNGLDDRKIRFLSNQEKVYPTFESPKAYLEACKSVLTRTADDSTIEKLRKCDSITLVNRILKYKNTKKSTKTSDTEVFGNPLEMVLSALWDSFALFTRNDFTSFQEIISVRIEPVNYFHNIPASDINDNVVVGEQYEFIFEENLLTLIGGIDNVLDRLIFTYLKEFFSQDAELVSLLGDKQQYEGRTTSKPASIPALQFAIIINNEISTRYIWKIDDTNPYAISGNLVKVVEEQISTHHANAFLPTFKILDYKEVFAMLSEEDMRESFRSSIGRSKEIIIENLLDDLPKDSYQSRYFIRLSSLGSAAQKFYSTYSQQGLYAALESTCRSEFVNAYSALLNHIVDDTSENDELFFPLLTYAFWVIDQQLLKNDAWKFDGYMSSGIVTLLHPAMVEMIHSQMIFLTDSFIEQFKTAIQLLNNNSRMTLRIWDRSIELATLQSPVPCLLVNKSNISTRVRGEDVFYRIGVLAGELNDNILLTRFRMANEDDYDTISDSALTRVGEESTLLKRLIQDYFHVYALAQDGISLAIFKNFDIQPIVAAIIELVKELIPQSNSYSDKWYDEHPFLFNISFYSDTTDDSGISNWITRWQDFWANKAQTDVRFSRARLSISHRMLEIDNTAQGGASFEIMIADELDADISILYEMPLGDSGNTNLVKIPKLPDNEVSIKFPLLEKLAQRKIGFKTNFKRSRILSNRQFSVYRAFLRYLYAMKLNEFGTFQKNEIIINEERDFSKWKKTLEWCHKKSERVICIGGEIDKNLITDSETDGPEPIVVGFGSGVGAHAELNYTVSCQVDRNYTIIKKLAASFLNIYPQLLEKNSEKIVKNLYQQSKRMADLSLVRTIGTTDYYNHDYFGYTLARRLLKVSDNACDCDVVLSLDSYRHWFQQETTKKRADLLWLRAKQVPNGGKNKYVLMLTIIEVKMGYNTEYTHLDKAIKQVQSTVPVLKKYFRNATDGFSPDSRYWWMQLYRIIAANPRKHTISSKDSLECLESLAEGVFEIEWDANIFCFDGNDLGNGQDVAIRYCEFLNSTQDSTNIGGCDAYIFSPAFVEEFGLLEDEKIPDWESHKQKINRLFQRKDHSYDSCEASKQEREEIEYEEEFDEFTSINDDQSNEDYDQRSQPSTNDFSNDMTPEKHENIYNDDGANLHQEAAEYAKQLSSAESGSQSDLRVLIGTTKQGKDVFWEFGINGKIVNRHMFILGGSGSGKTYAIQGMLAELGKAKQASLILDYTNGFTMNQVEEEVKPYMRKQWYIANRKLTFNPFLAYTMQIDPDDPDSLYTDQPVNIAQRIVDVFIRVYGSIGENQISILTDTIEEGLKTHKEAYSLTKLYDDLQSRLEDPSVKSSVTGLINNLGFCSRWTPLVSINQILDGERFMKQMIKNKLQFFNSHKLPLTYKKSLSSFLYGIYGIM
nr:DUF87 domain-containing protein [uncultured Sphaerochaeta sp.]